MESDAGSVAGSDPVFEPAQPLDTARKWGLTPWRRRVIAIAEILLCSSVPTQILIGGVLLTSGMAPLDVDGTLSLPFVLVLSVADTILLVGLMVWLTRIHGDSVAGLWLGERPVKAEALHGLLLIPVVFVMVVILLGTMRLFAPWLHNVTVNPLEQLAGTPGQAALFAIVAIVAGGLREELQRAFLLRRFEQHLGGVTVG